MAALRGIALAPAAARWLAATRAARVLNVFERACNLINQDEAVLALVTSERGLTPFGLVVAGDETAPFRGLPLDSVVDVENGESRLTLGRLVIEYGAAAHWEARPDWAAIGRLFQADPAWPGRVAALAAEVDLAGSLLDLFRPAADGPAMLQALLATARPGAVALVQGLRALDAPSVAAGVRALAGVGGGLTPAGDDFLVGALLAAWAGLYGVGAETLGPDVAAAAAPRTTTLSAAYLRAAAAGECMVHWHTLFQSLLREDGPGLPAGVRSLVSVGHTSGADALAGFLAVHYVLA